MRYKRRYLTLSMDNVKNVDEFSENIYTTLNKFYPLLGIRANVKIIKELYVTVKGSFIGVISVSNKYKYDVIFILSLMRRVFSTDIVTLGMSGTLTHIKNKLKEYGTNAK